MNTVVLFNVFNGLKSRVTLMVILITITCVPTYYLHVVANVPTVFTHSYYIPIVLAALWWRRKGVLVAVFLAGFLSISHVLLGSAGPLIDDVLRGLVFVVVALVVTMLGERIARTNRKIEESEQRFHDITEHAMEWVWEVDADGVYTYTSPVCERFLGYKPDELLGEHIYHFSPVKERMQTLWKMREYFAEKTAFRDLERRKLHRDGHIIWTSSSAVPVIDDKGNLVGYRGSDIDITSRRRHDLALRESEELMSAFIQSAADNFMVFDADLNLINLNGRALFGRKIPRGKMIGTNILEMTSPIHKNGRYEKYIGVLRSGKPCEFDIKIRRRDNGREYYSVKAFSVGSGMGLIITHITDRKEMELRLQQQNKALDIQNEELITQSNELMRNQHELMRKSLQLEEVCRGQSRFLASISHELRTPLNAIIGFSELIEDGITGAINEEQRDCVGDILLSGHHLLDLINDILDTSRMEAGRMMMNIGELPVISAINEAVKVVQPLLRRENLTLETICEDDLPLVRADGNRVKQVIMNLLSNAIKFTPPGGEITVSACRRGGQVLVSVTDTGCGIKKADRQNIFKAYTQSDTLLVKKTEGTGLGLKLCNQFIALMGGTIWLESSSRKGSVFSFTLPLAGGVVDVLGDTSVETGSDNVSLEEESEIATEAYQSWRDGTDYSVIRSKTGSETGGNQGAVIKPTMAFRRSPGRGGR